MKKVEKIRFKRINRFLRKTRRRHRGTKMKNVSVGYTFFVRNELRLCILKERN